MQLSNDLNVDDGIQYPEWQKTYQDALLELDQEKFDARVTAAESAIFNRLQAIAGDSVNHAERQALQDAIASLRVLKRNSY
jgi:hypothetical protein